MIILSMNIVCEKNISENRITAKSDGYGEINYIFPFESCPVLTTSDFAVWGFLPVAMRLGINIHIHDIVSSETLESAKEVSTIWASWLPDFYHNIQITADNILTASNLKEKNKKMTFFSGGVDSTYSSFKSFQERGCDSDCLTVHGMDYKFDDNEKFNALIKQTEEFRKNIFNKSRIVKTDAYSIYSKFSCNPKGSHVTHIFSLFSCGTLFEEYEEYRISADYRLDQQFMVHPYGSNTASNRFMKNNNGKLITVDDNVTRSQKTQYLSSSNLDLTTLSICVDYSARPKNCGNCSKCMRTKAMFYAFDGKIPDIFVGKEFNENWYKSIPLASKINRAFLFDILSVIEKYERNDEFPGYYDLKKKLLYASKKAEVNPFYGMKQKDMFRKILKIMFKY